MIKRDNIQFSELTDIIQNSSLYKKYCSKYNIDDIFTFLAFVSEKSRKTIYRSFNNYNSNKKDKKLLEAFCQDSISTLCTEIFFPLSYFSNSLKRYNQPFDCFGKNDNPFQISSQQYINYLQSNTSSPTKSASNYPNDNQNTITLLEQCLKTMFISNRAAKLVLAFSEHDITNSINQHSDKTGKKINNKVKLYNGYKKIYNELYTQFNDNQGDSNLNYKRFMSSYLKFLHKEISREDLEASPEYGYILNTIQSIKDNTFAQNIDCLKRLKKEDIDITPDSFFRNAIFTNTINRLYICKSFLAKNALKTWIRNIKKYQDDKSLSEVEKQAAIKLFKSKYRITYYTDDAVQGNEPTDSNGSQTEYDTCLCFIFKGYNVPFRIHTNLQQLIDLQAEYGVEFEKGDIDMQNFISDENEEVVESYNDKLAFKPILPYKYTEHQLSNISELYEENCKYVENYGQRNQWKSSFLKYSMSMIDNLMNLTGPSIPNVPTIDAQDIGEKSIN